MKHIKSLLRSRAFTGALVFTLLAAGIGGYVLLADRPVTAPPPPVTEIPAPKPVPTVEPTPEPREELAAPVAAVPTPEPEPEIEPEAPVSAPVFIPDDTPVIVTPPKVIVSPLEGEVVTAFSVDRLLYSETLDDWRTHDGIDIAAELGDVVLAACAGDVLSVEEHPLMGVTVVVRHEDGHETTYANLQPDPDVVRGDTVSAGQVIGVVGNTAKAELAHGPHLHFSVTKDGEPVDPAAFLE